MDWQPTPVLPAPLSIAWGGPLEKKVGNPTSTLDNSRKYNFGALGATLLLLLLLTIGFCSIPLMVECNEFTGLSESIERVFFRINYYNGNVSLGQRVGVVTGSTFTTNIDSLGWHGLPFSFNDMSERGIYCGGLLINSETCFGLEVKMYATADVMPINPNSTGIRSLSRLIISPLDPIPSLSTSLTIMTAISLATVSIAFIFSCVLVILPLIKKEWISQFLPNAVAFSPLFFSCISFFCILSTLVPSIHFSIPARKAVEFVNPTLVNGVAILWTGMGSLWWGGGQIPDGLTYENEIIRAPLTPAPCYIAPGSINYRVVAAAFNFFAALVSIVFQNLLMKL